MSADPLTCLDTGGSGLPIVLIHGMTFSKETWDPIVARLRDRFRCVAVDLPGHGGSTGSGSDPRTVVARIQATLLAHGVDGPVVVGHSAGALHATGYAATYETSGVVNVDQPLRVAPFAAFVQHLAPALRGPDFGIAFRPFAASIGVTRLLEPEQTRVLSTQHIDQQLVLDYWAGPMTLDPAHLQTEVDAMLDRISVPYLWLAGGPIDAAERDHLLTHIPHAHLETWSTQGHLAHLADPDQFAHRITQFATARAG